MRKDLREAGQMKVHSLVFPVIIGPLLCLVTMYIHVHPHQQFHEGTFTINADVLTADDLNEFFLSVDGAANSINASIVTISTGSKKVSDHKQIAQTRVRIILW